MNNNENTNEPTKGSKHQKPQAENQDGSIESQLETILSEVQAFRKTSDPTSTYITVKDGATEQHLNMKSRSCRRWLYREYRRRFKNGKVSGGYLSEAIERAAADAEFEGEDHDLHVRVASHSDAWIYDLGDEQGTAIKLTSSNWKLVQDAPVKFVRPQGAKALAVPSKKGDLKKLRRFLNTKSDDDFATLVIWLLGALCPNGPHPVLSLIGSQGSCKSTMTRMLTMIVDPKLVVTRSMPSGMRDLAISARNTWVLAYDNVSRITPWLSDACCSLSTGLGFGTRQLYTDTGETQIYVGRPVIINSITEAIDRPDLLDRTLQLELEPVTTDQRKTEQELNAEFKQALPEILGALLDAVVHARANVGKVPNEGLPRMADFAKFAIAAEPALGLEPGTVLRIFENNRRDADTVILEQGGATAAIYALAQVEPVVECTATNLLDRLKRDYMTMADSTLRRVLPPNARSLSTELRRTAPNLARLGVQITFLPRTGTQRKIRVEKKTS